MPGAGLAHGPPAKKMQAAGTTGSAENVRHPPRDGFNAYTWSPRCTGLFGHRVCDNALALRTDTSVGVSGPHDFAVRCVPLVRTASHAAIRRVHRIPLPRP